MAKRKQKQWFKRGSWWNKLRLNRQHKDRLFHYLFKDKKEIRSNPVRTDEPAKG